LRLVTKPRPWLGYIRAMRTRTRLLRDTRWWVLWLVVFALPLQGLLIGSAPHAGMHAALVTVQAPADDSAAKPCHGQHHGAQAATAADPLADTADRSSPGCGCCAACGTAALPVAATVLAHGDFVAAAGAGMTAPAAVFETGGPERPPRA
jgi:hypothetical protein